MTAAFVGKYRLEKELGTGAHGLVIKAYDTVLDRTVALKSLKTKFHSPTEKKSLFKEAKTLARLSHKNIVTLYELIEQEDAAYLVMEYVDGPTLSDRIKAGPVAIEDAAQIIHHIADALDTASAMGVVHGDIKPANIMIDADSTARLVDFGLAKFSNRDDMLATLSTSGGTGSTLEGTLPYMAPEAIMGSPVTERADIFSLGAVFYEMITGKRAFEAPSQGATLNRVLNDTPPPAKKIRPETPDWIDDLIMAMLVKDPEARIGSMARVRMQLGAGDKRDWRTTAQALTARLKRFVQRKRLTPQWLKITAAASVVALTAWALIIVTREVAPPVSLRMENGLDLVQHFEPKGAVMEAQDIFGKLLSEDPDHAGAQAGLALALMREYTSIETDPATLDRATAYAESALAEDPHLALANIAAGWAAEFNGDFDRALELYEMADLLSPNAPFVYEGRGRTYKKQGDYGKAIATMKEAIEYYPEEINLYNDYGDLLLRASRYAEAESIYRQALTIDRDNTFAYAGLGQALHMQGETKDAVSITQDGLKTIQNADLYNNLGTYLFFLGRYEQAAKAFERTLEFDGNSHDYFYWANLADAYRWSSNRKEEAENAYSQAIQLLLQDLSNRPNHPALLSRHALFNAKLGELETAKRSLDKVVTLEDLPAIQLYRATVTLEILSERDTALSFLARALDAGYALAEIAHDPELKALRQDPRYLEILTRKGLRHDR